MEKGLLLTIMVMAVFFLAAPAAAFGPNPDGNSRVELISSTQKIGWKGDNDFRVDTRQSLFGVNVGFAPTKNLELSIGGGAVKTAADKVFVAPGGDDGVSDVMMVELAEGEQYYDHQNFNGGGAYGVAKGKIKFVQGDTLSLGGFIQGSFYRETEDKATREWKWESTTEGGIEGYSFGYNCSETQTIKILDQWDATLGLTVQADVSKNVRLWTGPFYKAAGGEVLEATTREYKFRATMTNPETGEVLFDDTWTDTTGEVKSRSLSSDNFGAFVGAEVQVGGWALSAEAQVANKTSWSATISYFF